MYFKIAKQNNYKTLFLTLKLIEMNYWLIKSEPFKYSWDQFIIDKKAVWDGVRNYSARNNLRDRKSVV